MGFKETMRNVRNANTNKAELDKAQKMNRIATGGLIGLGIGFLAQAVYIHKSRKRLLVQPKDNIEIDRVVDKLGKDLKDTERKFCELISDNKDEIKEKFEKVVDKAQAALKGDISDEDDYIDIGEITVDDVTEEETSDDN